MARTNKPKSLLAATFDALDRSKEAVTATPPAKHPGLTGVAVTMQASREAGFSNFRIVKLFIVEGEIVHVEKSQPYATFEALAFAEVHMTRATWNLSSRHADGHYQSMGNEDRDALVERLKVTDPDLLERIRPALALPADAKERSA